MQQKQDKKKILLIEDDKFIADMYTDKFKMSDFDLKVVYDGELGLEHIKRYKPDLVLLDIVLPKLNGFEILEIIRKEGIGVIVLLLTNLGQQNNIRKGMYLGAKDYIIKANFTPQEVVDRVAKFLVQ